ncbi:hypothetical protein A3H38_00435 [candidate division WOR-1 bacterium RIFCSPLOWO2_02_FULL_46_20]|uniref:Transcriptional regulator n=2 Tax=Saganbacteria TaxID=1703751 RepID=A0A1F4RHM4_UNCSA|nr:MAG: hypothetical protein A3J44_06435 [candidate division WOR-1 bacterium RIFCSPHIGHO2_02_FULL_45_12]OGC06983.1 MAG: hypothetical protein A3H38_00435 [candidate division WOR-1 bacterium RIFCSPLOWO2_02_FULL_46_20]OGC09497.1 MAG: hypothetical protein A3F86_02650 [candidate division WOR-1 bacterium RIFCSPLOWO2_12_FULL_45_9]
MPVPFFDITRQNNPLKKELDKALLDAAHSGKYILGPNVAELEKEFAIYCGAKHSIGVASGTDSIELALVAAGVKPGDEVITSPFTFVATAEAIVYCGATPVYVDINPQTFNIDASKIATKITKKTRAILPVHLFGLAAEMDKIVDIAQKNSLAVVEDCAQATGAQYAGKRVGSFGLGAFSFFPTKNLGCFGDGGAITTNDAPTEKEVKVLRNHGSREQYRHNVIGFNSRLDELQAVILRIKLPLLDSLIEKRRNNATLYYEQLKGIKQIALPFEPEQAKHTYNQFTIKVKDRDKLQAHLKAQGVASMVYYPISLHLQEAFAHLGHKAGDFPESEAAQKEVLSLPIFPELSKAEINEACFAIREYFQQ